MHSVCCKLTVHLGFSELLDSSITTGARWLSAAEVTQADAMLEALGFGLLCPPLYRSTTNLESGRPGHPPASPVQP